MAQVTDLRLPADRAYAVVAKRTAGAIGAVAGLDVDQVDEVTIAVAQAFDNAIRCLEGSGFLTGQVRIAFKHDKRGLEVTVRSSVNRDTEIAAREHAQHEAVMARALVEEHAAADRAQLEDAAATDLALRLMGLFVDQSTYQVDERTGGLRVRLTKYRAS
ncbi:MAG: ATP-binding protein [Candidatus Dormibacteraeota bacterium]|nr:ATP-binding protein [Candidatus Dormibacteraeota bacterium]